MCPHVATGVSVRLGLVGFSGWVLGEVSHRNEILDGVSDRVDAPLIRGIEFEDHRLELLAIHLTSTSDDGGGLAGARRAVE